MRAFLNKLLSSRGLPVSFVVKGETKFNRMYRSVDDMANDLVNLDLNYDAVYFALATYRDFRSKGGRKANNVLYFKTLWMDIDVDLEDPNKYSSKKEVLAGLRHFLSETGFPKPMVVNSGNGIHIYWPLDSEITIDQWQMIPDKLIAVCQHIDFKIDPLPVKLPTQVLRPIGTHHRKDPNNVKEIQLLMDAEPSRFYDLEQLLDKYIDENQISIIDTASKRKTDYFQQLVEATGWTYEPPVELRNADPIIQGCKQIREAGSASEPVWRGMLSIIRLCEDGDEIAHLLSQEDPRYNPHDVDAKLANLDEVHGPRGMPMTCEQFKQYNPEGCVLCTNRVTSPIVLGIPDENVEDIKIQEQIYTEIPSGAENYHSDLAIQHPQIIPDLPPMTVKTPGGLFNLTEDGVVATTYEDDGNGNRRARNTTICSQRLFPINYIYKMNDEGNKEYYYMWRIEDRSGGFNDCIVNAEIFHSKQTVVTEFAKYGVIIENQNNFPRFGHFMRTFIKGLTDQQDAVKMYNTFGWQENGDFVCGQSLVTPEGRVQRAILNEEASDIAIPEKMTPTGEYDEWRKAIDVFNKPGQEHSQLAILSSFAGPLMKFTGIRGFVLSLQGKSGAGKSTIQEAAASVWGSPKPQLRKAPGTSAGDTNLSVSRAIGVMNHLPTQLEEITNMPDETISDFIYSLSLGHEKSRLKQSKEGYSRNAGLSWQTVFVSSSNRAIRDKLSAAKIDFEAESMRIFEITNIPVLTNTDLIQDTKALSKLEKNYGHAGLHFAKYLQANRGNLKGWVDAKIKEISKRVEATQSERFWVQGLAAWFVGAEIAKYAGLIDFDLKALEEYAIRHYYRQRKMLTITTEYTSTSFSEMINGLLPDALVTTGSATLETGLLEAHLIPRSGRLNLRLDLSSGKGWVSTTRVRTWANQNETSVTAIISSAIENNYMESDEAIKHELGYGVKGYSGVGAVRCYEFKLNSEEAKMIEDRINDEQEVKD